MLRGFSESPMSTNPTSNPSSLNQENLYFLSKSIFFWGFYFLLLDAVVHLVPKLFFIEIVEIFIELFFYFTS